MITASSEEQIGGVPVSPFQSKAEPEESRSRGGGKKAAIAGLGAGLAASVEVAPSRALRSTWPPRQRSATNPPARLAISAWSPTACRMRSQSWPACASSPACSLRCCARILGDVSKNGAALSRGEKLVQLPAAEVAVQVLALLDQLPTLLDSRSSADALRPLDLRQVRRPILRLENSPRESTSARISLELRIAKDWVFLSVRDCALRAASGCRLMFAADLLALLLRKRFGGQTATEPVPFQTFEETAGLADAEAARAVGLLQGAQQFAQGLL